MPYILSAFWANLAHLRPIKGNLRTVLSASEQSPTWNENHERVMDLCECQVTKELAA
jgi:hypothetical protein